VRSPFSIFLPALFLIACGCAGATEPQTSPAIEWDRSTLTLIQEGAGYARMIRLDDGQILCCYDRGGVIRVRKSKDDGKHWSGETLVAQCDYGVATNPEILKLSNGWVLLSYNERPRDGLHPFAIRTSISKDAGATWSRPALAYAADTRHENGCWEPAQIQLPSGEIQLFFANENPYWTSDEQDITKLRSSDNAATWSKPQTVSFRPGHRDGMPSPLLLRDGKGIVVAIEDRGVTGFFNPVIIYSPMADNWSAGPVDGASERRWCALSTPVEPPRYASAPCIRQLPSGRTILSAQSNVGRKTVQMVVYVGDDQARNFAARSTPFDLPDGVDGLWNSLFLKDASTVTAISGTVIDGVRGLWAIDGRVVRAGSRTRRQSMPALERMRQ